ncbi:MAG TPA: phosphate ABC transporter substrate-binding protein [Cyanobacteria bacterium UBA11369]|nr:phosphate ABC transporter substrate-binding protein [Cyanobacteria bacterium UBA11371]HBE32712.1 phosphate ABC transporter substrate-binding protein [Cyanobacteria bacterium UBA11368]HBE49612.1 phosphate ABC transporter substrate-binding protein [Cyanobacteria bacterium UBA11369]
MSQKNETTVLILALLITTGLIGLGFWWFTSNSGDKTGNLTNQTDQSNGKTFTQVKNVPSGLFSYGGSTTWATIRRDLDPAIQTVWPQFKLRYTHPVKGTPSTGAGIRMLLDNQLSFAHASRPIEDKEYEQAKQRGFTLVEIPVAIDGRAIAVHPSLNIPGITMQQRDDIYAGKITNWKQLGGPNLRIKRYAVQGDEGDNLEIVPTPTEAIRKVAEDPAGMFEASAPLLVPQCKVKTLSLGRSSAQLITPYKQPFVPLSECPSKRNEANTEAFLSGEYPLTRRLFVAVKKNNQIDQQAGEAYANLLLTEQGQKMIEKAGFVRIR